MIRLQRTKAEAAYQAELDKLYAASKAARESVIDDFEKDLPLKVVDRFYKCYRKFLLAISHEKCAYCETKITAAQPGDVEHFRPKGRVVDDDFKPIRVSHPTKGDMEHPGYYWLAYDWSNLLPACTDCNRFRLHGIRKGAGKADRFPLENPSERAIKPSEETREKELLIDPCRIDPDEHLTFLPNGMIQPKTEKGKTTLGLFGLNIRETLLEARARSYDDARRLFRDYVDAMVRGDPDEEKKTAHRLNQIMAGEEPYTAMQRVAIDERLKYLRAKRVPIDFPLVE